MPIPKTTTRRRYAALGAFLALGGPLGLLVLRAVRARAASPLWLVDEVSCDAATYLYVAVSTMLAFSIFGFALGLQADRLRDLSRTDPLTELLNRRALQERFEEEFARASRHQLSLSVLLVDVDGLKNLNDREGHRQGDAALQETASALRRGSRITDVCARWGGDEFVVLAPETDRDEALHLAERVRLTAGLSRPEGLTVSIGVATQDPARPHSSADALMSDADGALYDAKRLGKNRVVAR